MNAPRYYGRSAAIRAERHQATRNFIALHAHPFHVLQFAVGRITRALGNPRLLTMAALLLFAAFGTASASVGVPLIGGMIIARRSYVGWNKAPAENDVSEMPLTRGMLQKGLMLQVPYSVNVTGAGSGVRDISIPIKRVSVIADGTVLCSANARDLVNKARIFSQMPVGSIIVAAADATVANKTGLSVALPIYFAQPRARNGLLTALPTWAYQDVRLRVEWGGVAELFTNGGTLAGVITFGSTTATPSVTQLDLADFPDPITYPGGPNAYARSLLRSIDRSVEVTQAAVAQSALELDLGTLTDLRAIILTSEVTSTGEPGTFINFVTLKENKATNVYENVRFAALRSDNADKFGVTMPTACAVIDFAESGDINDLYRATQKSDLRLVMDTGATAGTIRAHLIGIGKPLGS